MLLDKILKTTSVPNDTQQMILVLENELSKLFDCTQKDNFGSVCFTKKIGEGKKLMLCCGIDGIGVVATFVNGSKVNIHPIGNIKGKDFSYEKVTFGDITGVVLPPKTCNDDTPFCEYVVETYNNDVENKIKQGQIGCFEGIISNLNGVLCGVSCAQKACVYVACKIAKDLVTTRINLLEKQNIGELCVCFMGQNPLNSRSSKSVGFSNNADFVVNVAPFDVCGKNGQDFSLNDGLLLKMIDKAYVADENFANRIQQTLDELGISHKRCVSCEGVSPLWGMNACENTTYVIDVCVPCNNYMTPGECVKLPF